MHEALNPEKNKVCKFHYKNILVKWQQLQVNIRFFNFLKTLATVTCHYFVRFSFCRNKNQDKAEDRPVGKTRQRINKETMQVASKKCSRILVPKEK